MFRACHLMLAIPLLAVLLAGCNESPAVVANDDNKSLTWFEDTVLKADKVVLVDFTAAWCGPCQTLKPLLHKLEQQYSDRLKVVAVDIDEHPAISMKYPSSGVPHIVLFSKGQILMDPGPGAPPTYEDLEGLIVRWLPKTAEEKADEPVEKVEK
jgi:thioredoxin 1